MCDFGAELLDLLEKNGLIHPDAKEKAKKLFENYFSDKRVTYWSVADVEQTVQEMIKDLQDVGESDLDESDRNKLEALKEFTSETCSDILFDIDSDAEYPVTWSRIRNAVEIYLQ
mgnify:CR=1 FL=1